MKNWKKILAYLVIIIVVVVVIWYALKTKKKIGDAKTMLTPKIADFSLNPDRLKLVPFVAKLVGSQGFDARVGLSFQNNSTSEYKLQELKVDIYGIKEDGTEFSLASQQNVIPPFEIGKETISNPVQIRFFIPGQGISQLIDGDFVQIGTSYLTTGKLGRKIRVKGQVSTKELGVVIAIPIDEVLDV